MSRNGRSGRNFDLPAHKTKLKHRFPDGRTDRERLALALLLLSSYYQTRLSPLHWFHVRSNHVKAAEWCLKEAKRQGVFNEFIAELSKLSAMEIRLRELK